MESASALPFNGLERPMVVKFLTPLTRGNLRSALSFQTNLRFIPAYARNSPKLKENLNNFMVHPRLRGELS